MAQNSKGETIWKCSVQGCKNKDNLRMSESKIKGLFHPVKETILCEEHKTFFRDEYKGYVCTFDAMGCGCCAMNKLFEPDNPKPIREGQVHIDSVAQMLAHTWKGGVDVLIKNKSLQMKS